MAVVSGQKISELAILNLSYTSKRELMNCVVNEDQVAINSFTLYLRLNTSLTKLFII